MVEDVHPSAEPPPALGQLVNWPSWRDELQQFAAALPALYATDALVAVDRTRRWIANLTVVQTSAVIEARRQGSTWRQIARHVGAIHQSAWEGWHDVDSRPDAPPPRLLIADTPGQPSVRYEDGTRIDPHHPPMRVSRGWWAGCSGCLGDDGPYGSAEAAERSAMGHTCWRAWR